MDYKFSEVKTPKGLIRFKHWVETHIDEGTGESFSLKRKEPIELDGEPLVWYSLSQIDKMSRKEQKEILI